MNFSAKPPLPDANYFSGRWQNDLKKPLPESVDFSVKGQVVTFTKASLAYLLNYIDSCSQYERYASARKNYISTKIEDAGIGLNRYKFDAWNKLDSQK